MKKQKSLCACVYDVRIVQYDWWNNRSQALFKTIDHRSRLPNKLMILYVKWAHNFNHLQLETLNVGALRRAIKIVAV